MPMISDTLDLLTVCGRLPPARRAEVADFARFLLSRESADGATESTAGATAEEGPWPTPEAFFAEMEPFAAGAGAFDDSRGAIYQAAADE